MLWLVNLSHTSSGWGAARTSDPYRCRWHAHGRPFGRKKIHLGLIPWTSTLANGALCCLPSLSAYAAAESVARVRGELLARGENFVFETVLSDPEGEKIDFLRRAAEERSCAVLLCFIGIDSVATSNERVFIRVTEGGHDVPENKLLARFPRTMANLARAVRVLPRIYVFDNSDDMDSYRFVQNSKADR